MSESHDSSQHSTSHEQSPDAESASQPPVEESRFSLRSIAAVIKELPHRLKEEWSSEENKDTQRGELTYDPKAHKAQLKIDRKKDSTMRRAIKNSNTDIVYGGGIGGKADPDQLIKIGGLLGSHRRSALHIGRVYKKNERVMDKNRSKIEKLQRQSGDSSPQTTPVELPESSTSRVEQERARKAAELDEAYLMNEHFDARKNKETQEEEARQQRVEQLAHFMYTSTDATDEVVGLIGLTAHKGGIGLRDLQRQLSHGKNRPSLAQVLPKAEILKSAGIIEEESVNGEWKARITSQDYADALDIIANGQVPSPEAETTDTESSQEQADNQENQTTSEEAAAQPEQEARDAESIETPEANVEYFDDEILEKVRSQLNEKITSAIDFLKQEQGKTPGGAETESIVAEERKNVFIDILSDDYGANTLDPAYDTAIKEGVARLSKEFDNYVTRRALGLYEESESIVRTMVNEDTSDKPISRKYQEARARVWYAVREGAPLAERDIIMETFDRMKAEDAQKRREKRDKKAEKAAGKSAEQAVADNAARTAIES